MLNKIEKKQLERVIELTENEMELVGQLYKEVKKIYNGEYDRSVEKVAKDMNWDELLDLNLGFGKIFTLKKAFEDNKKSKSLYIALKQLLENTVHKVNIRVNSMINELNHIETLMPCKPVFKPLLTDLKDVNKTLSKEIKELVVELFGKGWI